MCFSSLFRYKAEDFFLGAKIFFNVQGDKGAQILLVPDLVDFLTSALSKVFMPLEYIFNMNKLSVCASSSWFPQC